MTNLGLQPNWRWRRKRWQEGSLLWPKPPLILRLLFFGERQDWLCSSSHEWTCTHAWLPWSLSFFSTSGNVTNDESRWQEFSWRVFDGRHAMQESILLLPDVGDCSSGRNIFFEPGRQHYPKNPCMSTTTSFRVWESGGNSLNSGVSSSPKLEIVSKCFQLVPSNIHEKYAKLLNCWWTKNWSFELHVTKNEGVESVLSCWQSFRVRMRRASLHS